MKVIREQRLSAEDLAAAEVRAAASARSGFSLR